MEIIQSVSYAVAAWISVSIILGVVQLLVLIGDKKNYHKGAFLISGIEVNITGIIVIASVIKLGGVDNSKEGMSNSFIIICSAILIYSLLYWYHFSEKQKLETNNKSEYNINKYKISSNIINRYVKIKLFGKQLYEKNEKMYKNNKVNSPKSKD